MFPFVSASVRTDIKFLTPQGVAPANLNRSARLRGPEAAPCAPARGVLFDGRFRFHQRPVPVPGSDRPDAAVGVERDCGLRRHPQRLPGAVRGLELQLRRGGPDDPAHRALEFVQRHARCGQRRAGRRQRPGFHRFRFGPARRAGRGLDPGLQEPVRPLPGPQHPLRPGHDRRPGGNPQRRSLPGLHSAVQDPGGLRLGHEPGGELSLEQPLQRIQPDRGQGADRADLHRRHPQRDLPDLHHRG